MQDPAQPQTSTYLEFDVQIALDEGSCVYWHAFLRHHLEAVGLDHLTGRANDLDVATI